MSSSTGGRRGDRGPRQGALAAGGRAGRESLGRARSAGPDADADADADADLVTADASPERTGAAWGASPPAGAGR